MFKIYTYSFCQASFHLAVLCRLLYSVYLLLDQSFAGLDHILNIIIYELGRRFSCSIHWFPNVEIIHRANLEYTRMHCSSKSVSKRTPVLARNLYANPGILCELTNQSAEALNVKQFGLSY